MANSIVHELQRLASGPNQGVTPLLRKALIVASKLNIGDFKEWVRKELLGYTMLGVPDYRLVPTEILPADQIARMKSFVVDRSPSTHVIEFRQPIAELEQLIGVSTIQLPVSDDEARRYFRGKAFMTEIVRVASSSTICGIVDCVKTVVLEWSLALESAGIVGEDVTFSAEEIERASSTPTVHIHNFLGVLGSVTSSQLSQMLGMPNERGSVNPPAAQ